MKDINESDWKYLQRIKKTLLDRLCNRILDRIQAECSVQKREPDAHELYCKIYNFVKDEDKVVADCFDDWRRSTIIFHIIFLIQHQVMTEEEVEQLSDETKQRLKFHLEND